MALYFNLPVNVAVQKDLDADTCNNYYWARFSRGNSDPHHVSAIPTIAGSKHIQIINFNNVHYNVIVNSDSHLCHNIFQSHRQMLYLTNHFIIISFVMALL